jgi:hypothetical protein
MKKILLLNLILLILGSKDIFAENIAPRFFKESNLSDCQNQSYINCYARIKMDQGSFEGEFGNGVIDGKGVLFSSVDQSAFIGNFTNNEISNGIYVYTNTKDFFRLRNEALAKNLNEEDRLKFIINNFKGKYYIGHFQANKRDGKGIFIDTFEGYSQDGFWKEDQFISGEKKNFGWNNSRQANNSVSAKNQCEGYGFQSGTNAFAQCLMQIDMTQRQIDAENQARANLSRKCELARANGFNQQTRTGHFVESLQLANQAYDNCMAGLPPPKSGLINCSKSGENITCFAQ